MTDGKNVRVGVGVFIRKDGKVLMGKRKGSHGEGHWGLPGGHLEFNEEIVECAIREVKEETNLKVKNIHFGALTNDIFKKEGKHYITIYMVCDYSSGKLKIMEPDKCQGWGWFKWGKLPSPLFIPLQNLLKQKYNPTI